MHPTLLRDAARLFTTPAVVAVALQCLAPASRVEAQSAVAHRAVPVHAAVRPDSTEATRDHAEWLLLAAGRAGALRNAIMLAVEFSALRGHSTFGARSC